MHLEPLFESHLLARYRFIRDLAQRKRALDITAQPSAGPTILAEADQHVTSRTYDSLKSVPNQPAAQSTGLYDLVLSLDFGFGAAVDPLFLLNRINHLLVDDGMLVVAARLAPSTIVEPGEPIQVAFRFESLADLLRQHFRAVTYVFQHGDEFRSAWDAYSDEVLFFCFAPKATRQSEMPDLLQRLDTLCPATAKGMVPFSIDYLRAHLAHPSSTISPSAVNHGRLLFYIQPQNLYDDALQAQRFFEQYRMLGRQYRDLGWEDYYSTTHELKTLYCADRTFCPEDFRRPPATRDWRASYFKTLKAPIDDSDPEIQYWAGFIEFLLDRIRPDAIFVWNKNLVLDSVARRRGVLVVHNEVALDRKPRPATYFFDPIGINAEAALPKLWRSHFHNFTAPAVCRDLLAWYRTRYAAADIGPESRAEILRALALPTERPTILVPLQVENDSNVLGNSPFSSMADFCRTIIDQVPKDEFNLIIKPHPADPAPLPLPAEVHQSATVVGSDRSMGALLTASDYVFTISSTSGYEALTLGKHVVTFGVSPFAGLGFSLDVGHGETLRDFPRRCAELMNQRSPEQLDAFIFLASLFYPISERRMHSAALQLPTLSEWIDLHRRGAPLEEYWMPGGSLSGVDWERFAAEKWADWRDHDYHQARGAVRVSLQISAAREKSLAAAARQHAEEQETTHQQALAELTTAHEQALAEQATAHQQTLAELATAHQRALAALSRQLSETEALLQSEEDRSRRIATRLQSDIDRCEGRAQELCHELDLALMRHRTVELELQEAREALASAEQRLIALDQQVFQERSVRASGPAKRALHVTLDGLRAVVPEVVRARVRKQYLDRFYYRVYPEKRPPSTTEPIARSATAHPAAHSGYAPFVTFKTELCRGLPLDFATLASHEEPNLVSVVLPVYNGERYLRDSIESVLSQTHQELELIVVDDGSTDRTPEILAEYAGNSRVRVIRQSNARLPAALTRGFEAARGEFYTWTSDDNLMLPNQLAELVAFLRSRQDVEFVYADEQIIGEDGQPALNSDFCPGYQTPSGSNLICWPRDPGELNFVQNNYIGGCFLYRAWAGKIVGAYADSTFGFEDYEYWMRMNALFRIAHLGKREPLYQYRLHGSSLSARERELRIIDRVRDFMAIEGERRRIFLGGIDVTFVGQHPWIDALAGYYRGAGHNVVRLDRSTGKRYEYSVTRAHPKRLAVFAGPAAVELPESAIVRNERGIVKVILLDDTDAASTAESVFRAADWFIATGPAAWRRLSDGYPGQVLRSSGPNAIAYPLLALVNRLAAEQHEEALSSHG